MILGAHVSTSGGLDKAMDRAKALGCDCIQIFAGSPMMWRKSSFTPEEIGAFKEKRKAYGIGPVFIHASYLVNLASSDEKIYGKSVDMMRDTFTAAEKMGADGVIVHLGSTKGGTREQGVQQVLKAIRMILKDAPGKAMLLLETTAGMGSSLATRFEDLQSLFKAAGKVSRLGLCLDTAHVFEAGYDLATEKGFVDTIKELNRTGLHRLLRAVHANDSKTPFHSNVDRHENIGEGHIGLKGIQRVILHPLFKQIPFILETPGFDGEGPDPKNMKIMRKLEKKNA